MVAVVTCLVGFLVRRQWRLWWWALAFRRASDRLGRGGYGYKDVRMGEKSNRRIFWLVASICQASARLEFFFLQRGQMTSDRFSQKAARQFGVVDSRACLNVTMRKICLYVASCIVRCKWMQVDAKNALNSVFFRFPQDAI